MRSDRLKYLGVLIGAMIGGCTAAPAEGRDLTINVTVQAPAGVSVASVPVGTVGGTPSVARTDASGNVTLTTRVEDSCTKVLVGLSPFLRNEMYPEFGADNDRYLLLTKSAAFERCVDIPLAPDQGVYHVNYVGKPVVKVSGIVSAASGPRSEVFINTRWRVIAERPSYDTGVFEISVAQGEPAEMFFKSEERGEVIAVRLTAAQTAGDHSLGEVTIPTPAGRRVEVTVVNQQGLRFTPENQRDGRRVACIVSSDGNRVYSAGFGSDGKVVLNDSLSSPLRLPPGTYFGATGGMGANSYGADLWRLLKDGRLAEVQAAQVPSLVVPDDGATTPVSWTLDAAQAATAIRSIH